MIVKVAPIGERVVEVNVEQGATVGSILEVAGVLVNGRTISVNNSPATENTSVNAENAIIALAAKMKGGKA